MNKATPTVKKLSRRSFKKSMRVQPRLGNSWTEMSWRHRLLKDVRVQGHPFRTRAAQVTGTEPRFSLVTTGSEVAWPQPMRNFT
jgi:hypothetical protein